MTRKFLSLIKCGKTSLVYHGARGETVILSEKQPHGKSVRLFEHIGFCDRFKLECALDSGDECEFTISGNVCAVTSVSNLRIAAVAPMSCQSITNDCVYDCFSKLAELETGEIRDSGLCFAEEMISKILGDISKLYPDMEFEFSSEVRETEVLAVSTPNLMRICMLSSEAANAVSCDRRLKIRLDCVKEELKLTFLTGCEKTVTDDGSVALCSELAEFAAQREGGTFELSFGKGSLGMSYTFRSQPDEMPDFKFRDQFEGYGGYLSKVQKELSELRTEKQGKHKY